MCLLVVGLFGPNLIMKYVLSHLFAVIWCYTNRDLLDGMFGQCQACCVVSLYADQLPSGSPGKGQTQEFL